MHIATRVYAKRVPMDIISTRAFRSNSSAMKAERKTKAKSKLQQKNRILRFEPQSLRALKVVPATTPEDSVATTGLPLLLTLLRDLKSRPSRAIAKSTRGMGNMDPSRLGRGKDRKIKKRRPKPKERDSVIESVSES
jgi:hypothetical protein